MIYIINMDSEIEPIRRKTRVASKIHLEPQEESPKVSIIDSTANEHDESERETINTEILMGKTQIVEPDPYDGGKVIDDVIKKMGKRISRHRLDLDQLIKTVGTIDKRNRNIVIDQKFIDQIGRKLGEKFASKQEVIDLTNVVKDLSTDIDQLFKSLDKNNDKLNILVKQRNEEHKEGFKEEVKEVVEEDVVDSEDEGDIVVSGNREVDDSDAESDGETVKTDELKEIMAKSRAPVQTIVDAFSETEDVALPKQMEQENQSYNFIYAI
jgi:hypothetical protein